MLASSWFLLSSVCCAVTRYVARSHPPGRQGLASSKRCQQSEDVPNIVRCRRIKFKSKGVSSVKLSGEETFFLLAFIWTKDINVSSKNALGRLAGHCECCSQPFKLNSSAIHTIILPASTQTVSWQQCFSSCVDLLLQKENILWLEQIAVQSDILNRNCLFWLTWKTIFLIAYFVCVWGFFFIVDSFMTFPVTFTLWTLC